MYAQHITDLAEFNRIQQMFYSGLTYRVNGIVYQGEINSKMISKTLQYGRKITIEYDRKIIFSGKYTPDGFIGDDGTLFNKFWTENGKLHAAPNFVIKIGASEFKIYEHHITTKMLVDILEKSSTLIRITRDGSPINIPAYYTDSGFVFSNLAEKGTSYYYKNVIITPVLEYFDDKHSYQHRDGNHHLPGHLIV